jgi:hypothetical protein
MCSKDFLGNEKDDFFSIKKTKLSILFREIIAVEACSEKCAKHINKLYGQNVVYFNLMFCGPCIGIYMRNKKQQDALFTFNLFQ